MLVLTISGMSTERSYRDVQAISNAAIQQNIPGVASAMTAVETIPRAPPFLRLLKSSAIVSNFGSSKELADYNINIYEEQTNSIAQKHKAY